MEIDPDRGCALVATALRRNPDDLSAALFAAAEEATPDDPESGWTDLWEFFMDRLDVEAGMMWEGGMAGSAWVRVCVVPLTPDSVWTIRDFDIGESEKEVIAEYQSRAAADESVTQAFLDLLPECGPPDRLSLPDGFTRSRFRELTEERIAQGEYAFMPWRWSRLSEIVLRFTNDDLPYETETQQRILLDCYLDLITKA